MRISLIPDEYTYDPATAFELGRQWGIEHYEVRYAYGWRVPVAPGWVADRVAAAAKDYEVKVTGISPGLFKPTMRTDGTRVPLSTDTPAEIRRHLDELLASFFAFAERLGTRNVTVFALPRGEGDSSDPAAKPPQVVIDTLAEAADKARAGGFRLLLENGGGTWADTSEATAAVLEGVASEALRLTWDPANVVHAAGGGDPVADGYPLVRAFVANVHVKDVLLAGGGPGWAMLGDGVIDWAGQLRRLREDGYAGPLTVEPHLQYQPGLKLDLVGRMEQFLTHVRALTAAK